MTIAKVSKEVIHRTVATSQRIEGYSSASKSIRDKVQNIKKKHNVKVSAKG